MWPSDVIFGVILGLVLLVFGRKLFWLFVAITGFLVGVALSSAFLPDQPKWIILCVGLGAGLLGALLAVFAERLAFALAGFYAGSYLALILSQSLDGGGNSIIWFVLGGVMGAVIASLIMDWAIIVLSCLVGAGAILQALQLGQTASLVIFAVLLTTGIVIQRKLMVRSQAD
jgi:hypothetical protein